ncbi:MAG TPA: hypothetical protein VIS48_12950 [Candidatus Kryptonia bacterium]
MSDQVEQAKAEWKKQIEDAKSKIVWNCNFPVTGWHETGCPHRTWTTEELHNALIAAKASMILMCEDDEKESTTHSTDAASELPNDEKLQSGQKNMQATEKRENETDS